MRAPQNRWRAAFEISAALTLAWFVAGVLAWPDVDAPAWYRWVLSLDFGVVAWCALERWFPINEDEEGWYDQ